MKFGAVGIVHDLESIRKFKAKIQRMLHFVADIRSSQIII